MIRQGPGPTYGQRPPNASIHQVFADHQLCIASTSRRSLRSDGGSSSEPCRMCEVPPCLPRAAYAEPASLTKSADSGKLAFHEAGRTVLHHAHQIGDGAPQRRRYEPPNATGPMYGQVGWAVLCPRRVLQVALLAAARLGSVLEAQSWWILTAIFISPPIQTAKDAISSAISTAARNTTSRILATTLKRIHHPA